jgi:hypothetical protein
VDIILIKPLINADVNPREKISVIILIKPLSHVLVVETIPMPFFYHSYKPMIGADFLFGTPICYQFYRTYDPIHWSIGRIFFV